MKTWSLTPILTSAYLSAMLTSGIAPIRPSVIFAAAVDPMVAQKALQNAVSAMSESGWAIPTTTSSHLPDAPQVSASTQIPKADPVMTDELMARMIKFTRSQTELGSITSKICGIFKLCDGTTDLKVMQIETENPEGHYFMIPATPNSQDIIIAKKNADGSLECYLTDKSYKLRAAAISVAGSPAYLVANEKASEKYKAELTLMAKEAAYLPPTGTRLAGNS